MLFLQKRMAAYFMNFNELNEKYKTLQAENKQLKEKIHQLENIISKEQEISNEEIEEITRNNYKTNNADNISDEIKPKHVTKYSPPTQKIALFASLFRGRENVFATR